MNNLREGMPIPTHTVQAQVFRCPSCGSPMQARSKDILAVGCASCGAVVDTADENYKILSKALGNRDENTCRASRWAARERWKASR
jgi:DNA-directed RNA polymerase subunit N (RpoN/RPB10)